MGAGGSADAMKFSDVLILVGVGVLCAGFIIHGWVETTSIDYAENPEYSKSLTLLEGDKVDFNVECISAQFTTATGAECSGNVIIYDGSEEPTTQPYQLMEGEKFTYTFDSKESGSLPVTISIDWGEAEAEIDVKRVLMLDFIIYPIGIAILLFGLQKRRIEKESAPIDAEI
tara:strand:+ start:164 stop:679 length:516 start_codon:yes stop_codon:yes gene_type:complete